MLAHQMNLENSPHLVVPDPAVLDLLYSQSPEHFELYLKKVDDEVIDRLINKTTGTYKQLFSKLSENNFSQFRESLLLWLNSLCRLVLSTTK